MPNITAHLFYTCCNMVSRETSQDQEPSPGTDKALQESLERLKSTLPKDFEWDHREGLAQVLDRGGTAWLTNVMVDVTNHLTARMIKWIVVRLSGVIGQRGIAEKHLWMIARRIVDTLTWDEDGATIQALNAGEAIPSPPTYVKPDDIDGLLGAAVLKNLPALDQETKGHIWELFEGTLLVHIGGALPLCPSNFGKGKPAYDKRQVDLLLHPARVELTGCASIDGGPTLRSI